LIALEVALWASLALILYTHVGYPLLLRLLVGLRRGRENPPGLHTLAPAAQAPAVSLIVAAHDERDVIEAKLDDALAQRYRGRLEVIVASDGSRDDTVELASARARSDPRLRVLELARVGKVKAQDAAVDAAAGELLAFSDANAIWEPDALERLVARFGDPRVGYVCGALRYLKARGANQEGAYWRYEDAVRSLESQLRSVTAGNGAIYAVRRAAYLRLDPRTSHDLCFPFNLVKRGWLALYEPGAVAHERPVPSIEGEFKRKRRMMSHAWPAVVRGGMLDPRGYGLLYALEIYSHRALRYATPLLHVVALAANMALVGAGSLYVLMLALQLALLAGAALGALTGDRVRLFALCYYYLLVTVSLAAGLWDWLARGTSTTWERAEGRNP
jgi:cellulose synthase/poly-beta-1,6-N-acetylglucosamine synthase-like glycosyltransferase